MNEINHQSGQQLQALWSSEIPPAQDAAFLFAVLRRIEQRGFRISLFLMALHSVVAAWLFWLMMPTLKLLADSGMSALDGREVTLMATILVLVAAAEFGNSGLSGR